jgi:hypothetical protein
VVVGRVLMFNEGGEGVVRMRSFMLGGSMPSMMRTRYCKEKRGAWPVVGHDRHMIAPALHHGKGEQQLIHLDLGV